MEKIGNALEKGKSDTIILSNFTNFDWDTVYIISPFIPNGCFSLLEEKGIETQNFGKLKEKASSNSTENADIVIFLLKNKIVDVNCVPKEGWGIDVRNGFTFSTNTYIALPKDKAIFKYGKEKSLTLVD